MIRKCKYCGKEFEATGTAAYCAGPHYATCEVCGKAFLYDIKNPKRCCSRKCAAQLRKQTVANTVKVCELCGKEFTSKSSTARYCDRLHYRPCPVCGKPVLVEKGKEYEPASCCSEECTKEKRRRTSLQIYGTDVPSQSAVVKDKLRDAEHASRQARIETVKERYGVDNVSKNEEIKKKISDTVSSDEWQAKFRASNQEKFGVDYPMQSPEVRERFSEVMQSKYHVPWYCLTQDYLTAHDGPISKSNQEYGKALKRLGLEFSYEFVLGNYSYDIEIPSEQILLEIDPTYTHNSYTNHWGRVKRPNYHKLKSDNASLKGYRCIHVFDWDDRTKILELFLPRNRIYARKCEVVSLNSVEANLFLDAYHLQGGVRNQGVCYGLMLEGVLVQVMTFGQPRYRKSAQWELLRLCTAPGLSIVGGANRLFSQFIQVYHPTSIISYCDKAKFNGDIYSRLGFEHDQDAQPNKVWSRGDKKITSNLLLQRGYDQLFGTHYGKGTSNEQLMLDNGWLPVYDCGQGVYIWKSI